MTTYRKYDKRQKLAVVMAAEMVGVTAAAEQAGVPVQTASYWVHDPKFVEFRTKTREDMHDEVAVVAHLALKRVADTLDTMEPRDALFAMEKAAGLYLLMSGEPTSRSESKDITNDLDPRVKDELRRRYDDLVRPSRQTVEGASERGPVPA